MRGFIRLVPDDTKIQFMKGRFAGIATSAVLSLISVILFFHPGLHYGVDFAGGIVIEARTQGPTDFAKLRESLHSLGFGPVMLQEFGSKEDVMIRLDRQPGDDSAQQQAVEKVRAKLMQDFPGSSIRRTEAVGATVSNELFRDGMIALGLALLAMLGYIWFRFEWEFGVGAVVTLILDVTKVIGFYVVMGQFFGVQFNLTAVAAILTIMGYSINDKVVVYDRMRENLRKYKTMPLRQLIDLSINETLSRTIGTSTTIFLSTLPLVLFGGEALRDFAIVLLWGVVLATTSSIFIAAPILLFLGEHRLRRTPPPGGAAAQPA
jgi:preprotein translocase subunit SecF